MQNTEEISARMARIVEDAFQGFIRELNTFHSHTNIDTNTIAFFLNQVSRYNWLFWGYEKVMRELEIGDGNQISRVAQIREFVGHTQTEIQNLLNQYMQAQRNYQLLPAGRNMTSDFMNYQSTQLAEAVIKQRTMFNYQNRLRELTEGGLPFVQAQLIAKQETGYSS